MNIGYSEKEVARMYYGKWCDLFEVFKKMHNMKIERMVFKEPPKEISILDL